MFSSGTANSSLAVAETMRVLGHEVELIQMAKGAEGRTWWDDCNALSQEWKIVPLEAASGYDLILEIGSLLLSQENRKAKAAASVWVVRSPFLLQEIEHSLFPLQIHGKREFEGLKETWIFDVAAEAEKGAVQCLELLTRGPVRIVPFVWTPSVAEVYARETNLPAWLDVTTGYLKHIETAGGGGQPLPGWTVHVAETNTTNGSAAILPTVIMREAKRRGVPIDRFHVFNSDNLIKSQFYKDNILRHSTDTEVGLSGEFHGRQRSLNWVRYPMSCMLSHIRFRLVRPILLDLAWVGMPLVHNSPYLKRVGGGLERGYYEANHIGEACAAFRTLREDCVKLEGIFAPGATDAIRRRILEMCAPTATAVREGWRAALAAVGGVTGAVMGGTVVAPVAPVAPVVAAEPVSEPLKKGSIALPTLTPKMETVVASAAVAAAAPVAMTPKPFRVGFCDMWDEFDPTYNFFTLMLASAAKSLNPPLEVVGEPATPQSDVVIFGPFGTSWTSLPHGQPKVHFTGENTEPVNGPGVQLNLGFHHFDMTNDMYLRFPLWILEIDWFGADAARIRNPKPIPLERCTRVDATELAQKKKFCAFVVTNPSNPVRNAAFHWLSEYKQVDSAGRLFNNVGGDIFAGLGGGGGELLKHEFLKNYKFALTYENSSGRGYTTEKYLHAKAAGCVPIYWGDPSFERDFNVGGCIDARNVKTPEQLVELVRKVDEDDAEWLKRYAVPALDPYKVEWCRRTMAECARRILTLGGQDAESLPRFLTISPGSAAAAPAAVATVPTAAAPTPAPVTAADTATPLEVPLVATYVTRSFLPSLQHWLTALKTQVGALPTLEAKVFTASDVPADTKKTLSENFPFAKFEAVPDQEPPTGAFPDFWDAKHYGWKLWLYNHLTHDPALKGRIVLYMDAGAFLCRWPKTWMQITQRTNLCLLEDPREENRRWCSPEFCKALTVTEEELSAQQRLGGLVCFRAGSERANTFFSAAYELAKRRDVLVGPKWAGQTAEGKPFGHRHDQSIMSILSLRQGVPATPLDDVYCDVSLRKTFTTGRSIYVHRGNFNVHRQFAPAIDEAYVINLERRGDRLERLYKSHPELQGRVERWGAVDGRQLQLTPAIARLLAPNDFFWKKSVAGCALSHLGLWWKLLHETPDMKNYLILEDDVKFNPAWDKLWNQAVEEGHVPEDYDILYLGGILPPNRAGYETKCKERVNDFFCRVAPNQIWNQAEPTRYFHFCAYAYVLSRRGAEKVMGLLEGMKGYWTSADHILCNPVDVLKSYVFEPIVAGCYQDDDPKYATAEFNDFSRIDNFDSDLWNNDERFGAEEVRAALAAWEESEEAKAAGGRIPFGKALADAAAKKMVAGAAPAAALPTVTVNDVIGKDTHKVATEELKREVTSGSVGGSGAPPPLQELAVQSLADHTKGLLPRRFVSIDSAGPLDPSKFYEFDWLLELFGRPAMWQIESVSPAAPPPTDQPIVVTIRPHTEATAAMLEKWDSFGVKFSVLHLSDEHCDGPDADPIDFYGLENCTSVLRFYRRRDIPPSVAGKVTTIPLGYHWSVRSATSGPLKGTPQLPFRYTTWSFFGTEWNDRKELLRPLLDLDATKFKYEARFFRSWNDAECLKKEAYVTHLLDTVFVPCPDGINPETYRFYEALECGCIPLIVKNERNAAWVDWVSKEVSLLPLQSWEEAAGLVQHLMTNPQRLELYRNKVLTAWQGWKRRLQGVVAGWLQEE